MEASVGLAFPVVGVKFFRPGSEPETSAPGLPVYHGPSYCDAVRRVTAGEVLRLEPGSIEVCRWSPPVLGLKSPESDFERELEPRLDAPVAGILLARVRDWPAAAGDPDAVLLRADREAFQLLLAGMGDRVYRDHTGLDRTAVPLILGRQSSPVRAGLVRAVNRALGFLGRSEAWTNFTLAAFRHEWTSAALNFILDRTMANMSMCRNSTVIPLLGGVVNVSHFCTGGIAWGKNPPQYLTAGMPYGLYLSARSRLREPE